MHPSITKAAADDLLKFDDLMAPIAIFVWRYVEKG